MMHSRRFRTAAILSATAVVAGTVALVGEGRGATRQGEHHVVEMTAERFSFRPSEIDMRPGDTLELHLRSEDTAHGFRIAGTDIDVRIPKRGRGEVVLAFTPTEAGDYRFECSKLCGAGHLFMNGVIVVEDDDGSRHDEDR